MKNQKAVFSSFIRAQNDAPSRAGSKPDPFVQDLANCVVVAVGIGMFFACMGGLPIWVGFMAGFAPTFIIGTLASVYRA